MSRSEETGVLLFADPHFGKKTPTFDPDRCRAKVNMALESMADMRSMLAPSVAMDKLAVLFLGDVNDGSDIFPGQHHEQAITNVEEQARECAEMLSGFLRGAKDVFGDVEAYCVAGNHGRSGHKDGNASPRANWDIVAYRYAHMECKPKGIHVDIDDRRPFLRVVPIRGHGVLMHHGHFVNAGVLPGPALMRRLTNWSALGSVPPFEVGTFGHFHAPAFYQQGRLKCLISGTLVSGDSYPIERLGVESPPGWWFFGMSERRALTWQFLLDLDDSRQGGVAVPPAPRIEVPHVHGRDVILEPVQAGAQVVISPTAIRRYRNRPCARCQIAFEPTAANGQYCVPCRTVNCEVCGHSRVFPKYEAGRTCCSLVCAGRKGNRSQTRRG